MVDCGETALQAAHRELTEETGVKLDSAPAVLIYQGIGDGPRSTDNAWIETTAYHFHLQTKNDQNNSVPLGSSDALDARWMTVTPDLIRSLYADHGVLLSMALEQFRLHERDLPASVTTQLGEVPHVPLLTNLSHLTGRVGIFGGTFDPVHNGHIEVGMRAIAQHDLDVVVDIPTGHNPLKSDASGASPRERIEMLQYALHDHPKMFVSPPEARTPGVAYIARDARQNSSLLRKRSLGCSSIFTIEKNPGASGFSSG